MTNKLRAAISLGMLFASALLAQTPQPHVMAKNVSEMLARSEESAKTKGFGGVVFSQMLQQANQYPSATLDSVVGGLERIAMTSPDQRARAWAAMELASGGSSETSKLGIIDHALSLYNRSSDKLVRSMIVGQMANQREKGKAISFLKLIASQSPRRQDFPQASLSAVSTLSHMGTPARAALIDLRHARRMTDPAAIGFVNWFLGTAP